MDSRLDHVLEQVEYLFEALKVQRDRLARAAHTSIAQWATLAAAGKAGNTVPRIARQLQMTRQGVQRTADALVASHLARYEPNPNHRRSPVLVPTAEGERLLQQLEASLARSRASLGEGLEPEEIETTLLVLRSLRDDVDRS